MQSKHLRSQRLRSPRLPLDERLADEARFLKRWLDNPKVTGAVSPSGRFLARAMASYVDPAEPGPIIELGQEPARSRKRCSSAALRKSG